MRPSRRTVLGLTGATTLTLLAGCSTSGAGSPLEESTTETTTADTPDYEVRLEGPETDQLLFDESDIASVGEIQENRMGAVVLPVTLSEKATVELSEKFKTAGVDESPEKFEIVQFHEGTETGRFGISPELADKIAVGEWDGKFVMTFEDREQASSVRENLVGSEG